MCLTAVYDCIQTVFGEYLKYQLYNTLTFIGNLFC